MSSASSVDSVNEAAGSGFGNDRGVLNDGSGGTARLVSAGVLAREGGRRSRVFYYIVEQERLFASIMGRNRRPVPQLPIVEEHGPPRVDLVFSPFASSPCPDGIHFGARLFSPLPVTPGNVSSASSSGCPLVVGGRQDGNLDQSAPFNDGALNTPSSNRAVAGSVEEELAVRPRWSLPFYVPSSDAPNPVSFKGGHHGPAVELRMVGRQWIEPGPISHEWSAWCKPNIRRPVLSRSASVEVNPPSVVHASGNVAVDGGDGLEYPKDQFDDVLVQSYGYPGNGRQSFPPHTPLYNKFVGGVPSAGFCSLVFEPIRLRNIRVGRLAIAIGLHIVGVVRFETRTFIHNLGGRKTNTWCSALRVKGGHHEGRKCVAPGCMLNASLPKYCRIVYVDACKLSWCSVGSVAFHSFVWPRNVGKAKSINRTLFTNHCDWADVLIVRGRCFSSNKVCFRASRLLDSLLWDWSSTRRPYVVYREGNAAIGDCDPVPAWLNRECVHKDFCQCHLVGSRHHGWHHPGALCSNDVSRRHRLFEKRCGCSQVEWPFPIGCSRGIKNVEIAIKSSRIVMHVLSDVPPSVPPKR